MGMTPLMLAICGPQQSYTHDTPATSVMKYRGQGLPYILCTDATSVPYTVDTPGLSVMTDTQHYQHTTLTQRVVKSLIDAGADLNITDKVRSSIHEFMHAWNNCMCVCMQTGRTALMFAITENSLDAAILLVEAGADVDIQDDVKF